MTTIVNTPRGESSDSGLGLILGVIIVIALVVLFFVYGLPAIRQSNTEPNGNNINVTIPGGGGANTGGGGAGGTSSPSTGGGITY